jgi:mono/diheme cytochrome c family protein
VLAEREQKENTMRIAAPVLSSMVAAVLATGCKEEPKPQANATIQPPPAAEHVDPVKRGEQLVKMGGCTDCHTPMAFDPKLGMPVPKMERFLSGHPEGAPDPQASPGQGDQAVIGPTFTSFRAPFGVVYSANLTPDPDTGLGKWDQATFVRTMRTGMHKGDANGRPILPPMPWMTLQQASDEDLAAIFAYLRTIPAVKNKVPDPNVPPPALEGIKKGYAELAKGKLAQR